MDGDERSKEDIIEELRQNFVRLVKMVKVLNDTVLVQGKELDRLRSSMMDDHK